MFDGTAKPTPVLLSTPEPPVAIWSTMPMTWPACMVAPTLEQARPDVVGRRAASDDYSRGGRWAAGSRLLRRLR
jgi:hypothetical protein